jgi:hypothetical protein
MTQVPSWAVMWTLAALVFAGCKWLTWHTRVAGTSPAWKHVAYLFLWPGLDARRFFNKRGECERCRSTEWLGATARLTTGLTLLFGIAPLMPPGHPYVVGWIGMIGLVLILHFGVFHLLSCGWRLAGVDAPPLMNRPLASASLGEFWRRWNTAFRDLTHRFLFRPFASWLGHRWGLLAGFLFSGAVHDLVISVPARGGYGGPTLFFAVQGAGLMIERTALGRQLGLGTGWRGRLFAFVVLLAPVGLLFHHPFVEGIVVPFMRAMGAV